MRVNGLLKEGDEIAEEFADSPAINAALIAAAQKVEHYETASYGCLKEWAGLLGHEDALELLGEILSEEEAANDKLTKIAKNGCNEQAVQKEDENEAGAPARTKNISNRKISTAPPCAAGWYARVCFMKKCGDDEASASAIEEPR